MAHVFVRLFVCLHVRLFICLLVRSFVCLFGVFKTSSPNDNYVLFHTNLNLRLIKRNRLKYIRTSWLFILTNDKCSLNKIFPCCYENFVYSYKWIVVLSSVSFFFYHIDRIGIYQFIVWWLLYAYSAYQRLYRGVRNINILNKKLISV